MTAPAAPRPRYVDGLTGVRALAALWVLAHHLNAIIGPRVARVPVAGLEIDVTPLLTCGWVGVDIFFVLSAFLLTRQLLDAFDDGDRWRAGRRFLLHRVLRVYPAYLAQIAILSAVAWAATGAPPPWLRHLPLHAVMLQGVTPASESAINGVYWTLTVEFWFYLALPWAVAAMHAAAGRGEAAFWRRTLALYAAAGAVSVAFRAAAMIAAAPAAFPVEWAARQLPASLDIFAAGMVAAAASRSLARQRLRLPAGASGALVAGGLAGIVAMLYVMHERHLDYWAGGAIFYSWHLATAAFVALMVLGVSLDGRLSRSLFATPPARWLGDISYSLYLWHLPVALWVATKLAPASGIAAYAATAAVAAVAASALSYYAIERPVLARRSLIERRLPGMAAA